MALAFGEWRLAAKLNWPYCEVAGAAVLYVGAPMGSSIREAARSPVDVPQTWCFVTFSDTWLDVSLDSSLVHEAGGSVLASCIRGMVTVPIAEPPEGLTGGFLCGMSASTGRGDGYLLVLSYMDLRLDWFLGTGPTLVTAGTLKP